MLCQQVNLLLDTLGIKGTQAAQYADVAPTRVSKLRSGAEIPARDSSSIRQFVYAVVRMAEDTGQTGKLCRLIGIENGSEGLESRLTDWLYTDSGRGETYEARREQFRTRYHALLKCTGISSKKLSELSGINYSYVLRLYHGNRFPRPGSEAVLQMCDALVRHEMAAGTLHRLFDLTNIPPELCSRETLRDWLFGTADFSDAAAIRRLIETISTIELPRELPHMDPVRTNPGEDCGYQGDAGLREAFDRLLSSVEPGKELLLYSDHPMTWLSGDYVRKWTTLMQRCLRHGVRIRVVHDIDRSLPEMLNVLRLWMPLYLTRLVEPYYSEHDGGSRFFHTFFVCPEQAAVYGVAPKGADHAFRYSTDPICIQMLTADFRTLLKDCHLLLEFSPAPMPAQENMLSGNFGNIEVHATPEQVFIRRTDNPDIAFRFMHPLLAAGFLALLEGISRGNSI